MTTTEKSKYEPLMQASHEIRETLRGLTNTESLALLYILGAPSDEIGLNCVKRSYRIDVTSGVTCIHSMLLDSETGIALLRAKGANTVEATVALNTALQRVVAKVRSFVSDERVAV